MSVGAGKGAVADEGEERRNKKPGKERRKETCCIHINGKKMKGTYASFVATLLACFTFAIIPTFELVRKAAYKS